MNYELLLVGNPNVGKTSVFNRITRSSEHVGNWHGVTVQEKSKTIRYKDKALRITDLPGLYSLPGYSPEERLSAERIMCSEYSLIVNVCEVNNLLRNLYLTLQLIEAGKKVLLVVNMADELRAKGLAIDCKKLSERLNLPVAATSAKYGKSAFEILAAADDYLTENVEVAAPSYFSRFPIEKTVKTIAEYAVKVKLPVLWSAIKVLEHDDAVIDKLRLPEHVIRSIERNGKYHAAVVKARYDYIEEALSGVIFPVASKTKNGSRTRKLNKGKTNKRNSFDGIALNKYTAIPVFVFVMMLIFIMTFGIVGRAASDFLSVLSNVFLYLPVTEKLSSLGAPTWVVGLVGNGIIKGMTGVLVFLPQIALLFFFLALLEDSGYIARVAFMTDGMFEKIGLSGKSVFTLLMGFGCSATAVLTSRGLEDEKMRKKIAILTPFMSCSARMPVYMTVCSAFFSSGNWIIVFALYLFGAVTALSLAALFQKFVPCLKSGAPTFIMEMPPYRFPTAERVCQILWSNVKVFIVKVGTSIFSLNVIVWILSNFSLTDGFSGNSDSIMMTFSKFIAVIFRPLGFGKWEAVTALLSGLVAKEAVVSTIESLGGVGVLFGGEYANLDALAFMVYILLYVPCIATVSALIKEVGVKWTALGVSLQLFMAYASAFAVRQIGMLVINEPGIILAAAVIISICLISLKLILKSGHKNCCGCESADCGKLCKK